MVRDYLIIVSYRYLIIVSYNTEIVQPQQPIQLGFFDRIKLGRNFVTFDERN